MRKKGGTGAEGIENRTDWHTAFYGAIRLSFEAYLDALRFTFEHSLTAEPLRIDVIIEKEPDTELDTDLGRLFRRWNLVEYKGPGDTLSMQDVEKVKAYAHLYGSQNGIDSRDMTITFASTQYPRDMFKHLAQAYPYTVSNRYEGIYYITGYETPIQVAVTKRLNKADYLWLRHLHNQLTAEGMEQVILAGEQKPAEYIKAYLHMICLANPEIFKEVIGMRKAAFKQILEETDLPLEWREAGRLEGQREGHLEGQREGRREGRLEVARNLIAFGLSIDQIAQAARLDPAEVWELYAETASASGTAGHTP